MINRSPISNDTTSQSWHADNGNGTYSNPLFFDEFSDPDMIRVGDDYYMTGTTMHCMPGLPVLHSVDLVNWKFVSYAVDRLDLGPEYRLEDGKDIYGRGIWAPCFRYHNGEFLILSNVNGRHTQIFRSGSPEGPWTQSEMTESLHDLSVLFDDDGKIYVIWGYQDIQMAELTSDLRSLVPDSRRTIIPRGSGAGEGCHFLKIDGKYFIFSTVFDPTLYHVCARSDSPFGPYEISTISANESFCIPTGNRLNPFDGKGPLSISGPTPGQSSRAAMHQGAIIDTTDGEWWGYSMMDANSVGRITCLSPVAWTDGWPYFGLPGNLGRSPSTWKKPSTGRSAQPSSPYSRSDDFGGGKLNPVWQWNHCPDDTRWSLSEASGRLRLHTLPATNFWHARNSLTQRAVGPVSIATVRVETGSFGDGDVAGLALLGLPYYELRIQKSDGSRKLALFDQLTGTETAIPIPSAIVWLRAACDFVGETATFSYSLHGHEFAAIGSSCRLAFQLRTFQGTRYALFAYNSGRQHGGYADFADFVLDEPLKADRRQIPLGGRGIIVSKADGARLSVNNGCVVNLPGSGGVFTVIDQGAGIVALQADDGAFVTVDGFGSNCDIRMRQGMPGLRQKFQWQCLGHDDFALLSLHTNRYLRCYPGDFGLISADHAGPYADRLDGSVFRFERSTGG